MGLIKAALGAAGGTFADQWKEFFYCDSIDKDILVVKGQKRTNSRSSNTKGNENIISNGSVIAVADGQCMIIVEQGKVVEVCAEPGEFIYDTSTEPSIFSGNLGESIKESFKTIGKRFTFGGDTGKDQRVYYFNTKEIMDNKFGTPNPLMFDVVNKEIRMRRTVQVRCNGVYSYKISDPLRFYSEVCGNVSGEFAREEIDGQLKTEFVDALQDAFASLSDLELRPAQIPAHTRELKDAMNSVLKKDWVDRRGLTVQTIKMNPITLTEDDMKKINQMEDAATIGNNPFMMAGRMTDASANAMEKAAANESGAVNGFMGMGMAGMAGGGFNAAQELYKTGAQQQGQKSNAPQDTATGTWKCKCGTENTGKFCSKCAKPKPVSSNQWVCSCGTVNTGKFCSECAKPRPDSEWTCECGTVNKGKFCSECAKPRP